MGCWEAIALQGIGESANKEQYGAPDGDRCGLALGWSSAEHPISHRTCKVNSTVPPRTTIIRCPPNCYFREFPLLIILNVMSRKSFPNLDNFFGTA